MSELIKTPEQYLAEPYTRVLIPDPESGTYTAEILEFPGCVAQGDTPDEAYRNLELAAKSWIEAALDLGQAIPPPAMSEEGYGGKIALRLPRSLHRRAVQMAEREGVSLNQFLVAAIAERIGAGELYTRIIERLERQQSKMVPMILQLTSGATSAATTPKVTASPLVNITQPIRKAN